MRAMTFFHSCARVALAASVANAMIATDATAQRAPADRAVASSGVDASRRTMTMFGDSGSVGTGRVRTYVTIDQTTKQPIEVGIAFSATALDSLPTDGSGHHGQPGRVHQWNLALPSGIAAPFRFVEVNWNPKGHEPDGVYLDVPHFDFHFYTIGMRERDAIVSSDPGYAAKANRLPAADFVPPFTIPLAPPGAKPAEVAVPLMGVHWSDVRSPELQGLLGKPDAYKPFTATFIMGSWDGRFHFWEPMITRAHLLAKRAGTDAATRDEILELPLPKRYQEPGAYPTAYRIMWDADTQEYRVALTRLVARR